MRDKLIIIICFLIIVSCKKHKEVIVHECPSNLEAKTDILRALNLNSEYLNINEIKYKVMNDKCGFTFIYGNQIKFIEGSMTDIDFYLEVQSFYNLETKN